MPPIVKKYCAEKVAHSLDLISPYFHVVIQVKIPDLRNKYTVFTMGGTVSLPSVKKKFPDNYSSAAMLG